MLHFTQKNLGFNLSSALIKLSMLIFLMIIPVMESSAFQRIVDNDDSTECHKPYDTVAQKDIVDVLKKAHINVRLKKNRKNSKRNLGPFFSLMPAAGYAMVSGLTGVLVTNTSFYTDTAKNKMSSILLNLFYSQYNQFWTTTNSTIYLEKSGITLIGEYELYKFPTYTFGLGSHTAPSDAAELDYSQLTIHQQAMKEVRKNMFAGIGYNLDSYWNVDVKNGPGKGYTDFMNYGFSNHSFASGMSLCFLYDSRKNLNNPNNGFYTNIQYRNFTKLLGSERNYQMLFMDVRKYIRIPSCSRSVLAFWYYSGFVLSGTPAYMELPSTGWDFSNNLGRGYVQGRFRGRNLLYFESEYRFAISRNGLIGGTVFGNLQSYTEFPSNKFQTVVPGGGVGLRIKMNKFSKVNLTIDYGFGVHGSHGFFFNLGEVF
jgi:hypothetical protein